MNAARLLRGAAQVVAACIGLATLTAAVAASPSDSVAEVAAGETAVVMLPAKAVVYRVGLWKGPPSPQWSASAVDHLETGLRDAVSRSAHFRAIELPEVSPQERAVIDDVEGVAELLMAYSVGRVDRKLGPALAFLHERTGAQYALGAVACQVEQAPSTAAFGSALSAASVLLGSYWLVFPPVTSSYVAAFVIDLQTGEITWFNKHSGYEFAGLDAWDLRDEDSARKTVQKTLAPYPGGSSQRHKAYSAASPSAPLSRTWTTTLEGEFAARIPDEWRVKQERDSVTADAAGAPASRLQIQLSPHFKAFSKTAQSTTRKSTPEQLAGWYLAEIQAQGADDLQVVETSYGAQLAGQPAFRMHYTLRQPVGATKVRTEAMVIGTAVPHGLLTASLAAPQLHYFAMALPAFEASAGTLELRPYQRQR